MTEERISKITNENGLAAPRFPPRTFHLSLKSGMKNSAELKNWGSDNVMVPEYFDAVMKRALLAMFS